MKAYDPAAEGKELEELKSLSNVEVVNSAKEALNNSGLCFIATPWNEFKELKAKDFIQTMKSPSIYDAWNIYDFSVEKEIDYHQVGKNQNNQNLGFMNKVTERANSISEMNL